MKTTIEQKLQQLPCWKGEISFQPLSGGITNVNYLVTDRDGDRESQYVVRIGEDIPVHQVMRFNELAASPVGDAKVFDALGGDKASGAEATNGGAEGDI